MNYCIEWNSLSSPPMLEISLKLKSSNQKASPFYFTITGIIIISIMIVADFLEDRQAV